MLLMIFKLDAEKDHLDKILGETAIFMYNQFVPIL